LTLFEVKYSFLFFHFRQQNDISHMYNVDASWSSNLSSRTSGNQFLMTIQITIKSNSTSFFDKCLDSNISILNIYNFFFFFLKRENKEWRKKWPSNFLSRQYFWDYQAYNQTTIPNHDNPPNCCNSYLKTRYTFH
jgi:hypothetical protein